MCCLIFILSSIMDWYLEVRIQARDRQCSSCQLIPGTKSTRILKNDLSVPRRAQYLHNAWKRHQDAVVWVDIHLAIGKGLTFYQTRSNAIILQGTLPAYCTPKVVRLNTEEVSCEKAYMSPRPPPKISLRHDHNWTKGNYQSGSTVEQQPEGKVVRQSRGEVSQHATFSQLAQPRPKPICDRSGQPDNTPSVIRVQNNLSEDIRVEQTHDQGNLINTKSKDKTWDYDAQHRQWVNSWKNWGGHGLQHSRTTTFYCEAIA